MKALMIGGTGPTGPFIVNGLIERGFAVDMLHSGRNEIPEIPEEVVHIHTDAFDPDKVAAVHWTSARLPRWAVAAVALSGRPEAHALLKRLAREGGDAELRAHAADLEAWVAGGGADEAADR